MSFIDAPGDSGPAPAVVMLPDALGIEQAAALKCTLLEVVSMPQAVTLDGSAVREVHTAPLELLGLFWRERAQLGCKTRWQSPSAVLCEAAAQLGLNSLLGLDITGEPA